MKAVLITGVNTKKSCQGDGVVDNFLFSASFFAVKGLVYLQKR